MSAVEPARERIARQLQDAVERVRQDMEQVELWTEVLGCLARPVPDYSSDTDVLNRFALPPRAANDTRRLGDLGANPSGEEATILGSGKRSSNGRSGH